MPIFINENLEFHLTNKQISYIFKVLPNGQLGQLYFGKKLPHRHDFSHMLRIMPRGLTSCDFEGNIVFSMENIKNEYPIFGKGDFRNPAIMIEQLNGSRIMEFKYKSYEVIKGKPVSTSLPVSRVKEDEGVSLLINMVDDLTGVELNIYYTIMETGPILTRRVDVINNSKNKIKIDEIMSSSMDLEINNPKMTQFSGAWIRERHLVEKKLTTGRYVIESKRGASSAHNNPSMIIADESTTEKSGEAIGFALMYSGNFIINTEVNHDNITRIQLGINPFDFSWELCSGEIFETPEVIISYSADGVSKITHDMHDYIRNHIIDPKWNKQRPVIINNWEATYFDFDEDKLMNIASSAKELGVDMLVLDDGWFGTRNDDTSGLGDWYVNTKKLKNGLSGIKDKLDEIHMEFGIWIEPEMISKNSDLYRMHPEWMIQVPDRNPSHGRNQYVLDLSRNDVVLFLFDTISNIIDDSKVTYIKWDMNRNITDSYSNELSANKQKELGHRYILGLYRLMDMLTSKYPEVMIESCASGGGRFDLGMLYYSPQIWTSDDTDAYERLKIQWGTSMIYPLSSMGSHVSAVPNHQVGRSIPLRTRGNVATFGTFGYELDLATLSKEERDIVKNQIEFFKQEQNLIQNGDYYRLSSPFENSDYVSWMVVSKDKTHALLGVFKTLEIPNVPIKRIKLEGLDSDFEYKISNPNGYDLDPQREYAKALGFEVFKVCDTVSGSELMNYGIFIDELYRGLICDSNSPKDFDSIIYKLEAVK